jgi:hypothetical protein
MIYKYYNGNGESDHEGNMFVGGGLIGSSAASLATEITSIPEWRQ